MDLTKTINLLNSNIKVLKGVGEKKAALYNKLGIFSVWDLLYYFPRSYDDRTRFSSISDIPDDGNCCINARISSPVIEKKIKNKMSLYIMRVEDSTGMVNVKWFSSPFNKHKLKRGGYYSLYGSVQTASKQKEIILKEIEPYGENTHTGRIIPVYHSTSGLSQNDFRRTIGYAMQLFEDLPETLPPDINANYNLMGLYKALFQMHFPKNSESMALARYRFAFEELFILCLAMRKARKINNIKTKVKIQDVKCVGEFAAKLPFELTDDQKKAINEICSDLKKTVPMNRLIQGDVGCGKTAVAACSAYSVVKNGYQVAVMAPTEILAIQHYNTFCDFFKDTGIKVGLLTASSDDKKAVRNNIKNGYFQIVIGTHALIRKNTEFFNLGMCITDEQHRFGVKQRAMLADDENIPHVLVMSATPIPRTLSLVVYGDLDISVISTIPKGRQKVETYCIDNSKRSRLDGFIKQQVDSGFQCFVVCPLIESNEETDINSGEEMFKYFKKTLPGCKAEFIHGKMSSKDKDEIMEKFRNREFSVLVSTTVIEVGIDIPNATLIVIENAERFGLSSLHQLRGRVGRGLNKSYCILVSDSKTDDAKERMRIMCSTSDGFKVASEDLKLRGCGEFFGTRQHGAPELKVANLFTDMPIVEVATKACEEVLSKDPELENHNYGGLKLRIEKLFENFDNMQIFN